MNILSVLLGGVVIYSLCKHFYNRFWDRNLTVNLFFSKDEAYVGEKIKLYEVVTNKKIMPVPLLMVKFATSRHLKISDASNNSSFSNVTDKYYRNDVLNLGVYQKVTRTLEVECTHRGYFPINSFDLVYHDLIFGYKDVLSFPCDISLYVLPKMLDLKTYEPEYKNIMGDIICRRLINEDPFEFKGIRDYQIFDSMKSINWKASARGGSLKVNEKNHTSSVSVTILLNLESRTATRNNETDEAAISLAARFASDLVNQGIRLSFITNAAPKGGNNATNIDSGCGSNHLDNIMHTLARLEPSNICADFHDILEHYDKTAGDNNYGIIISTRTGTAIRSLINTQFSSSFVFVLPYNKYDELSTSDKSIKNCTTYYIND